MNVNQIINMVVNQLIRRGVNMAVNSGIGLFTRKVSKSVKPVPAKTIPTDVATPAELAKDAQLSTLADNASKTARMARRLGR